MNKQIKLFILCLCSLITLTISGQDLQKKITKQEAFELVKKKFSSNKNADFYFCENPGDTFKWDSSTGKKYNLFFPETGVWYFFVDAEPMKGWEHECYAVRVPKTVNHNEQPKASSTSLRMPPDLDFVPMEIHQPYGLSATHKPSVEKEKHSNRINNYSGRTYAIILSGGVTKISNHERYWNDCSFIYQTLVKRYDIPKQNIFVAMSDGTNPEQDMMKTTGEYTSSPLDLDFDGQPDIKYAATRENVKKILDELNAKMNKDDHLFLFVIDHGGTEDHKNHSFIWLWDWQKLYDDELAEWLRPLNEKSVYINAVLGQCYSGGFVEELSKNGCVVATAAKGDETSYGCQNIPYDEFVYHWTSAINGYDAFGNKVSLQEKERKLSFSKEQFVYTKVPMEDAFTYAKLHDRISIEHPQYQSNPISVGEDLAFDYIPESVCLYIRDNIGDTGKEPNLTTFNYWDSPDMWVRNEEDGIYEHENPYYSKRHKACTVYVRIHNRGKEDYNGKGKYLHLYWALASTAISEKTWRGREVINGEYQTGAHFATVHIEQKIPAGGSILLPMDWLLPRGTINHLSAQVAEKQHFCLRTKILDTFLDDNYDPNVTYFDVKGKRDVSQKNVSKIIRGELNESINVFIRNIYNKDHKYSLELLSRTPHDKMLFSRADVKMEMTKPIYEAWERGGLRSQNVVHNPNLQPYIVQIKSSESKLENVFMAGDEFEKVKLHFDFHSSALYPEENYTFDLIQRDENGNIVGGETFVVESPLPSLLPIDISPIDWGNGRFDLVAENGEKGTSFKWRNKDGEAIGSGRSIKVIPSAQGDSYFVTAISPEGELSQGSVTLKSEIGMRSVTPIAKSNSLKIELFSPVTSTNALIQISSLTQSGTPVVSKPFPINSNNLEIDISTLSHGAYLVTYIINGQPVNSKKFNK